MFVLNGYFCRELKFITILPSKLRFLLRNTGFDSDFSSEFLRKKLAVETSDLNDVKYTFVLPTLDENYISDAVLLMG